MVCCCSTFVSSPSIHSTLLQNSVFFDPKAFSGLNHKGVRAAYFLEWEEVEVGEVVAREVEVVSNPSVPVVGHGAPMLSASLSTRSCVSHFPHILSRFPLASSRPMRTGDGIADILKNMQTESLDLVQSISLDTL